MKKYRCLTHNFETNSFKKWQDHVENFFHRMQGYGTINGVKTILDGKMLKMIFRDGDVTFEEKLNDN